MNPYSPPALDALAAFRSPDPAYRGTLPTLASDVMVEHMRRTRPWVILISIVSFLTSGFILMMSVAVGGMAFLGTAGTKLPAWLGLVYLPIGALYLYPAVKLWTYSRAIGRLLISRGTGDLEAALDQQRAFWKYCGVAILVMIALYGVVFLGAIAFAIAKR